VFEMNEVQRWFLDAWILSQSMNFNLTLLPETVIGPYRVDFFIEILGHKYAVEIDGHEFHKTKEQRASDYKRERYLQKQGIIVVRFTGTEAFQEPYVCVDELAEIIIANTHDKKSTTIK
jgi:very-short-patch-repair endonuclease